MAWEYLKTKEFDVRYKIVADYIGDLSGKTILDLNCGEPHFSHFVKCARYIANDINTPNDIGGIEFIKETDSKVDTPCDVLACFGYGGGEFTGEKMESSTVSETIFKLAKYEPEWIVVEAAQKWQDDFWLFDKLKYNLCGYDEVLNCRFSIAPCNHYHNKRMIVIYHLTNSINVV